MRLLASDASLPGMSNDVESASPAGFMAVKPATARMTQRPRTSFLWRSTHRVRVVIALRWDISVGPFVVPGTYTVS